MMSMDIERIGFWREERFEAGLLSDNEKIAYDIIYKRMKDLFLPVEVVYHEPKVLDAEQIEMLREKHPDMRPYKPAFYTDKDYKDETIHNNPSN